MIFNNFLEKLIIFYVKYELKKDFKTVDSNLSIHRNFCKEKCVMHLKYLE